MLLYDYREVPIEHTFTAGDWYDGTKDALYKFWRRDGVDPARVLKRVEACMCEAQEPGYARDLKRLTALRDFLAPIVARSVLETRLSKAVQACLDAGVPEWRVRQVVESNPKIDKRY